MSAERLAAHSPDCLHSTHSVRREIERLKRDVERLQRWKAEAIEILKGWDDLADRTLGEVKLGELKSKAMSDLVERLTAENQTLRDALTAYADPGFYHACMFWFDPPTGGFDQDFSDDHGDEFYDRPMPGKLARAALEATDG